MRCRGCRGVLEGSRQRVAASSESLREPMDTIEITAAKLAPSGAAEVAA